MIEKEKLKKSSEETAEAVFNINEWAEKQKVFWDDVEKNGLRLPITDTLFRHKWPEEKPEYDSFGDNDYLVYDGDFVKAIYHPDGYFYYYNADGCVEMSEPICWWNLPEVKE
ncbi:hypothetical protein DSECCO2_337090 [anaerobic digester metagenome]